MKCLICNKEVKYIGQHIRLAHKEITQQQYYNTYIHEISGICPICGKSTRFIGVAKGYKEYCSQKCAVKDPKIKMLISEKTKAATEDIKKRNQEKYGCDWITQTDKFKQKSKETSIKKYGVEHYMQSRVGHEKYENGMLKKYGVCYPAQSEEIQQQIQATNIERCGVSCPLQQSKIREKALKNAQTIEAKQKRKNTNNLRYNADYQVTRESVRQILNSDIVKQRRVASIEQTLLNKHGVTCGYQIPEIREKALANTHSPKAETKRINTLKENNRISDSEKLFMLLADNVGLNYIHQFYSERYPFMCDFYIPDKDLFIEVNCTWTHNQHWYTEGEELPWPKDKTNYYTNAEYTWTNLDVRKRAIARENNLNYIVLWCNKDIHKWFALGCPIGKDWKQEYTWLI